MKEGLAKSLEAQTEEAAGLSRSLAEKDETIESLCADKKQLQEELTISHATTANLEAKCKKLQEAVTSSKTEIDLKHASHLTVEAERGDLQRAME
jgi:hypothetical protein